MNKDKNIQSCSSFYVDSPDSYSFSPQSIISKNNIKKKEFKLLKLSTEQEED